MKCSLFVSGVINNLFDVCDYNIIILQTAFQKSLQTGLGFHLKCIWKAVYVSGS